MEYFFCEKLSNRKHSKLFEPYDIHLGHLKELKDKISEPTITF